LSFAPIAVFEASHCTMNGFVDPTCDRKIVRSKSKSVCGVLVGKSSNLDPLVPSTGRLWGSLMCGDQRLGSQLRVWLARITTAGVIGSDHTGGGFFKSQLWVGVSSAVLWDRVQREATGCSWWRRKYYPLQNLHTNLGGNWWLIYLTKVIIECTVS
jgi:hypothetical protein